MEIVGFAVVIFFALAIIGAWHAKDQAAKHSRALTAATRQAAGIKYVGADLSSSIALSGDLQSVHLVTLDGGSTRRRSIRPSDLISVEVFEDGDAVTTTSKSRTIGGALVGGALLGGAGLILGGLSGKKRTTSTVRTIELRLTIADVQAPLFSVRFLPQEVERSSTAYESASKLAREWQGRLLAIMRRAEISSSAGLGPETPNAPRAIAPLRDGEHRLDC